MHMTTCIICAYVCEYESVLKCIKVHVCERIIFIRVSICMCMCEFDTHVYVCICITLSIEVNYCAYT